MSPDIIRAATRRLVKDSIQIKVSRQCGRKRKRKKIKLFWEKPAQRRGTVRQRRGAGPGREKSQ